MGSKNKISTKKPGRITPIGQWKDDFKIQTLKIDSRKYWRIGRDYTIALRGFFGSSQGKNAQKFYLGGSTSMRGWDVLRFEQTNSNEPVGKVNRFMINVEYRYPVNKLLGITIFADGGILSNHILSTKLGLIKWNNGLGLAIISTPQGVMSDVDARKNNIGGEVICKVF